MTSFSKRTLYLILCRNGSSTDVRETKCPESCRTRNKRVNTSNLLKETPEVNFAPKQAGNKQKTKPKTRLIRELQLSFFTLPRSQAGTGAHRYTADGPQRPIRRAAIQITIPRGGKKPWVANKKKQNPLPLLCNSGHLKILTHGKKSSNWECFGAERLQPACAGGHGWRLNGQQWRRCNLQSVILLISTLQTVPDALMPALLLCGRPARD